jgi:heme-degrading monooxygenase HmoA
MHARVITVQVQPGAFDEAIRIYQESVVPTAKEQPGCEGLLLLVNRHAGTAISISLWETEADLKAGETSNYLQDQLAKFADVFVPGRLPGRETYEVGVRA